MYNSHRSIVRACLSSRSALNERSRAKVYLIGAGPGDPGLLTLRAVECLQQADFVLYDYLTSPRTLAYAPPTAECLCVDQIPGEHPQRWPYIHQRVIDEAHQGKIVVHLKGGDPLIFGRGGEEAEALAAAGIPYEIVPGVTAAFAAGAYAEIPLTHRGSASALAIVTGHEHPGKINSRLDWSALARFPGTLAIYMGVARLGLIAAELITRGKDPETPVALVHRASTGEQTTTIGTLATIDARARQEGIASPSLAIVGEVVLRKPALSWFESRPLVGARLLSTRPARQALGQLREWELLGAVPYALPVLDCVPPADWSAVDLAIEELRRGQFAWLVFTSANGVTHFMERLHALGYDARSLRAKIAAIGPATAQELQTQRLAPDLVPTAGLDSEALAARLGEQCRGERVLLAVAKEGRETLREQLNALATVTTVAVYQQVEVLDPKADVWDLLRRGEIHAVTLTSLNIAEAFLRHCDATIQLRLRSGQTILVANSQRLTVWLQEKGYQVLTSAEPTAASVTHALEEWWRGRLT